MKHVSIDIETMATSNDAAVVGLGARAFDHTGVGKGFEIFINQGAAARLGRVDLDTMQWWGKQAAYPKVFGGTVDPTTALHKLNEFLDEVNAEYVWANGPQFDLVILRNFYVAAGSKFPFHYRAERDFRTIRHVAQMLHIDLEGCYDGTEHLPLDDATNQARVIGRVLGVLKSDPIPRAAPAKQGRGRLQLAPAQRDLDLVGKL
jgi:hypothetical protein